MIIDHTLQEHIDHLTKKVQDEIGRLGLKAAQERLGVNRPYLSRIRHGKQEISAAKLIEFAQKLGIEEKHEAGSDS